MFKWRKREQKEEEIKQKVNFLSLSIDKLRELLEEGNFVELTYILGNKKEIIKRNLLAGIFRGLGIRYWCYCYYCYTCYFASKNCDFEYSYYWWIYCWYCWNCGEKQVKLFGTGQKSLKKYLRTEQKKRVFFRSVPKTPSYYFSNLWNTFLPFFKIAKPCSKSFSDNL